MSGLLDGIVFWHWFILAVLLVILETLAPGVIFLWMAIAAGITGLALLALPGLAWEMQIISFAALSVVAGIAGRMVIRRHPLETDEPSLNRRGEQYIGRTFNIDEPIVNGVGKIRIGDSNWRITGDDLAAGTRVRVIGVEGASLRVEAAE